MLQKQIKNMRSYTALFLVCVINFGGSIFSQDLNPWVYGNLPIKMNAAAINYTFSTGNVLGDPGAPIQDFNLNTNILAVGYLRTFSFFGKLGRVQVIIPFSFMSGSLKFRGRDTSGSRTGFNDVSLRLGLNIFGSPPLEIQDYRKFRQEKILGASLVITIPVGQYYTEKLINIGSNRWGFRPEIGASIRVGQFYLETYAAVKFSTKNSEYLTNKTLRQSPLYGIQMHINHTFKNYMRLAFSLAYINGGQTSVNDVNNDDYIRHLRTGLTFGMSFSPFHSVSLQLNTSLFTNVSLDYKSVNLTYTYTWF
jgi:hypothetical protein